MTSADVLRPAEAFPVGDYLRDELDARGWTVAQFAEILGRPVQVVSEILNGHKDVTAETAAEIAAATDTEAQTWLRLQDTSRLWKLSRGPGASKLDAVTRRARLSALVPMPELRRRGVVPEGDLATEERAVCELLGIPSPDVSPYFSVAARRSDEGEPLSPPQLAWIACVRRAASSLPVREFDAAALGDLAASLTRTVVQPADLERLPASLADVGVRLVHLEPFKSSKIDGASYIDDRGPVIALSGRIPGLDSVLFTLLHEMAHIQLGHVSHGYAIDVDLGSPAIDAREIGADDLASRWALSEGLAVALPASRSKILACAQQIGVHPAVIVGRLHHTGRLPWSHLNNLIPNVRSHLSAWAH